MEGKVKFFNRNKGFGFIAGEDGNEYFVHQSALGAGVFLNENDAVTFDVEEGERGPKAVNVKKGAAKEAAEEETQEEETTEEAEETSEEEPDEEEASDEEEPQEE